MSENTPEDTEEAAATTAADASTTPPEPPKPDPKKPIDKALGAAAKAAKLKAEDVLAYKDYDDKLIVVTRAGQKVLVTK